MKKDLTISIVNYNSQNYLARCIASIFQKLGDFNYEVIIINNDKKKIDAKKIITDISRLMLTDVAGFFDDKVHLIELNENVGFGRAHNISIKKSNAQYIWFLNPDTEILSDNFSEVIDFLDKNPKVGVLGMQLVEKDNNVQSWLAGNEVNLMRIIRNNLGMIDDKKIWHQSHVCEVDWVSGGAMLSRINVLEKVNGFDSNYFLYFEDIDLCRRIRNFQKKVAYFPLFKVKHSGGGSVESKKAQKRYYYASQDYYFRKFYGSNKTLLLKLMRKANLF